MHESFWGTFIIAVGVLIISLIFFIQKITNDDEQIYNLLKSTTESAMMDSVDYEAYYNSSGSPKEIRINREAFVESFIRRFSQNASLANTYVVEFYDINEYPPKVSVRIKTKNPVLFSEKEFDYTSSSRIDAILETVDIES